MLEHASMETAKSIPCLIITSFTVPVVLCAFNVMHYKQWQNALVRVSNYYSSFTFNTLL